MIEAFEYFFVLDEIHYDRIDYHNKVPTNLADYYFKKYKRLVAGLDLKNMYYGVCVYEEKLSDDALVEILHHPMIRKVERDHEKNSLFVRLDGDGEYSYYDYYSNIEQCFREGGVNLKKNKGTWSRIAVMLTLASAIVSGRPVPEYNKYIEMIKFARNFMDADGLDRLIEMFDGSYVGKGFFLLHNECMSPIEFEGYEIMVRAYYVKCISEMGKDKLRTVQANYTA